MAEQFANGASSVLSASITSGATSLSVQSAADFPTQGNFALAVDSGSALEYMIVTAVSGTTFTVTRGVESTSAVAHNSGVAVTCVLTERSLVQGILDRIGTAANLPAITLTGDATGSGSGGSIATTVARVNGASVPAAGALTTGNVLQATGAAALGYGAVNLAGGSGCVTGTLPAANQAAQTMAGDVTGTTAAAAVVQLSGQSQLGGTGITKIPNGTAPTSNPAGAMVAWADATYGLRSRSNNYVTTTVAPIGNGTRDAQTADIGHFVAFVKTTNTTGVTGTVYTVPTGAWVEIQVSWVAKDTTTAGLGGAGRFGGVFYNNAGTVTQQGGTTDLYHQVTGGGPLTVAVPTFGVSGANVTVTVTSNVNDTIDWQVECRINCN